jgi:hypothetical protein
LTLLLALYKVTTLTIMKWLIGIPDMKKRFCLLFSALLLLICLTDSVASADDTILPVPEIRETFIYGAIAYPSESKFIAKSKPVGIGPLAEGGNTFNLQVSIGPFAGPVDMYLSMLSPDDIYGPVLLLSPDNTFEPFSGSMKPWRKNMTAVHEFIMDIPVSFMMSGPYVLMFAVMPADVQDSYYLWTLPFLVP